MNAASDADELIHRSPRSEIVRVPGVPGAGPRVLKIVPREAATPERIADLRREFERTSGLEGKNLVACLGLECRDDVWAMHLEDIGGRSLDTRLGEPLDREAFFAIAIGLAEALVSLHARGILHLRVCPAHVVYADAERALRLIDFSCAVPFTVAFADRDLGAHDDPWSAPELCFVCDFPEYARRVQWRISAPPKKKPPAGARFARLLFLSSRSRPARVPCSAKHRPNLLALGQLVRRPVARSSSPVRPTSPTGRN